jgi:hypothetical protein
MGSVQVKSGNGNDADTYGWDTACALTFAHANAVLVAGWPQVDSKAKTLAQVSSDDPDYHIEATLAAWQLTVGGDGKNVRLTVPIATGTYTAKKHVYKFDGLNVAAVIEIGMQWVPDPSQFAFVISQKVDTIKADLAKFAIDADLRTEFTNQKKPLSDAAKVDSITGGGKEWIIVDGTASYYIFWQVDKQNTAFLNVYQFGASWKVNLQALKEAVTSGQSAVVLINIVNNPTSGIPADVLPDLLTTWFNINIGNFNSVFAALDLSPVVAKQTSYTWMLPTTTSYAVVDHDSDANKSVFGVLTMGQNNLPPDSHQVSPYAIPAGADAGFLISGTNFMKNMMLAGAQLVFNNAPANSFDITNDGLTITNKARILFGKFHMDDTPKANIPDKGYSAQLDNAQLPQDMVVALRKASHGDIKVSDYKVTVTDKGSQWLLSTGSEESTEYIVNKKDGNLEFYLATSIYIDAKNFQMSLNHTWVQIQFNNVTYPYSADWNTHVTYSENIPLELKDSGGKKIFWFGKSFARNLVTAVTQTQSSITREIVMDSVMGALAFVAIAGPVFDGLYASAEVGEVSAEGGEVVVSEDGFASSEDEFSQDWAENEASAGDAAAESSGGRWGSIKNAFKQPRWKFVGGLAALAGGVGIGNTIAVRVILKNAASGAWDKVPGFDDFAQTAIAPYTWPNIPGFTLNSAGLAGSLQIGMTIKPGNA